MLHLRKVPQNIGTIKTKQILLEVLKNCTKFVITKCKRILIIACNFSVVYLISTFCYEVDSVIDSFARFAVSSPILISSEDDDVSPDEVLRERNVNASLHTSKLSKEQEIQVEDNILSNHDSYDASVDLFDQINNAIVGSPCPDKENIVPTIDSSTKTYVSEPESPKFMSLAERIRLNGATSSS